MNRPVRCLLLRGPILYEHEQASARQPKCRGHEPGSSDNRSTQMLDKVNTILQNTSEEVLNNSGMVADEVISLCQRALRTVEGPSADVGHSCADERGYGTREKLLRHLRSSTTKQAAGTRATKSDAAINPRNTPILKRSNPYATCSGSRQCNAANLSVPPRKRCTLLPDACMRLMYGSPPPQPKRLSLPAASRRRDPAPSAADTVLKPLGSVHHCTHMRWGYNTAATATQLHSGNSSKPADWEAVGMNE